MFTRSIKISGIIGYINTAVTIIVGFILTPLLIQSLGSEDYGLYSLVAGAMLLLATFDFGLTGSVSRFVAKYKAENNNEMFQRTINTVQFIFFIVYIGILIFGLFYIQHFENKNILNLSSLESEKALILIAILLPSIPAIMQTAIYSAVFNGSEHFVFPRILMLTKILIRAFLILWLIKGNYDSVALVSIDLIMSIITLVISSIYAKKYLGIQPRLSIPEIGFLKELTTYSFWVFVYALAINFFWQLGQISVASSVDISAVAIYSVCIMLGTYYGSFIAAYASMFMPEATRHVNQESAPEKLGNACSKLGKVNVGILFYILGGFYSIGSLFLAIWLGNTFNSYDRHIVWVGAILIMIGYTIPLSQSLFNQLLEAKGLIKFKSIILIIFLPTSAWLAKGYPSSYGVIGIITTMLIFWLASQVVLNYYYFKVLKINVIRFFIESYSLWMAPMVIATIIVNFISTKFSNNIVAFIVCGVIYTVIYFSTAFIISRVNNNSEAQAI